MKNYILLLGGFILAGIINFFSPQITEIIGHSADPTMTTVFLMIALLFGFGYLSNKLTQGTAIPSFVAMLLVGLVLQDILQPTTAIVMYLATVFATLILYLGGIEIDRKAFLKILVPTLSIAIPGYLITAIGLGHMLMLASDMFGLGIDHTVCFLLGAILGSTDPAALIPTLQKLKFKNQQIVNLSIAESAVNDVLGTVVTLILLGKVKGGVVLEGLGDILSSLATSETVKHLLMEIGIGAIVGGLSWLLINWYEKQKHNEEESAFDIGLLLFVPIMAWAIASMFHGAGFLAAFLAGLLAQYGGHHDQFARTSNMLESKIEVYAKPAIFILLGPLVNLQELMQYAWIGLLATMLFMVARIATVYVSLLPLRVFGYKFTKGELGFLCSVRETGVIPVVLLIVTATQFPQLKGLVPIGIWVVLYTLIVLPMITPWWAKKMKVIV
jgi:NhaP-type Na+/H+ or K+/H+ antiporter